MSSISISGYENFGNTDEERAEIIGKAFGLFAVVRYKNDPNLSKFTNFGTCENIEKLNEYLTSPYCHSAEVVYQSDKPPVEFSHQTTILDIMEKLGNDRDLKKVIELRIKHASANAASGGWTPLHEAAKNGWADIASLLIANGAEMEAKNDDKGYTPMHIAAHYGHVGIIKLLVDKGADIKTKCKDGGRPIHIAAENNKVDAIAWLVNNGDEINAKDDGGGSPLHFAVGNNHKEAVKFLIKSGADVNMQNDYGVSPLHYAAFFDKPEMIEILMRNGANKELVDSDGNTPMAIATANSHSKVEEYLTKNYIQVDNKDDDDTETVDSAQANKYLMYVENKSANIIYVKPEDGSIAIELNPGESYNGVPDGIAVPDLHPGKVYKVICGNGLKGITVDSNGEIKPSVDGVDLEPPRQSWGDWTDNVPDSAWNELFACSGKTNRGGDDKSLLSRIFGSFKKKK